MLYNKFIIYNNQIILGRVRFHKDLLPDDYDYALTKGGGQFEIDFDNKILKVFDKSFDFGKFDKDIRSFSFKQKKFENFTIEIIDV